MPAKEPSRAELNRQMRAFDRLPPKVRAAIRQTDTQWDCQEIQMMLDCGLADEATVLRLIK